MGPKPRKFIARNLKGGLAQRKEPKGYKETEDGICYAVIDKPLKK